MGRVLDIFQKKQLERWQTFSCHLSSWPPLSILLLLLPTSSHPMSRTFVSVSTLSLAQETSTGGTLRLSAQILDLASATLSAIAPAGMRSQLLAGEGASPPLHALFTTVTSWKRPRKASKRENEATQ